jgi:hypothetical protein
MAHACNSSTREAEAGVQQDYVVRLCLKTKQK